MGESHSGILILASAQPTDHLLLMMFPYLVCSPSLFLDRMNNATIVPVSCSMFFFRAPASYAEVINTKTLSLGQLLGNCPNSHQAQQFDQQPYFNTFDANK